jgi:hypothetical protein
VVDFKIGIGSHLHYDRGGQVYEILFELLQDNGLMFCITLENRMLRNKKDIFYHIFIFQHMRIIE